MKIEVEASPRETGAAVAAAVVALAIWAWAHRGTRHSVHTQYLYAKSPPTAPGVPPGGGPPKPPAGGKPGGWESW